MSRKRTQWALVLGLALAAFAAMPASPARAGGGCHSGATEATATAVDLRDFCFSPTILHVKPGQTVTWTNQDEAPHVVAGQAGEWGTFDPISKGATLSYRFTRAGVYPYTCFLHPGMNGAVVVGDVKAPKGVTSAGGGVVAPPAGSAAPGPEGATVAPATDEVRVAAAAASATPWKVATAVGFGLFAATLISLALGRRPRRKAASTVVA